MITGTTASGFSFSISDEAANDMELFDLFAEADQNPLALPPLINRLLGTEQKKRLYDHLRNENGIVPIDKVGDELLEMLNGSGAAGKKS